MRHIPRHALSTQAQRYLHNWTGQLLKAKVLSEESDRMWPQKSGTKTIEEIRKVLTAMNGPLANRCMYCEYSEAGDIDHFDPRSRNPILTFTWENLLLACHLCNHHKHSQFKSHQGLLPIDPTSEDPRVHLQMLPSGAIRPLTPRGEWSIELFDLHRELIVNQRRGIWTSLKELIPRYALRRSLGEMEEAEVLRETLTSYPFVSVFIEFLAISKKPHAPVFLPEQCLAALVSYPEIYGWIMHDQENHVHLKVTSSQKDEG